MFELRKKEKNNYEFSVKISGNEWGKALEEAYEKTREKFSVQGFRKGKAPRKVIEQNYGATIFYDDAFDCILSKEYVEILKQHKEISPIAQPEIKTDKFDEEKGIELTFIIPSLPEVKLGAYTGLSVESAKGTIDDAKVDAEIEQIRNRGARFVAVERKAQMGDFVTIDFVGRVDGKEFEGGKAEDYRLELGSHSFVDTFEDQIVGMDIGEKRVIKVTFPDNYPPELKNKPAEFDVTLDKVEEKELPELNDEFASNSSEFETFAEMKADIKKHLEESLNAELTRENENRIIDAVVKNAEVEIPNVMIEEQLDAFVQDFEMRLAYQGMKMEDYFNYTNSTMEDFRKNKRENAENSVKARLVIQEIVQKEKLSVSEKELDEKLQEIASKYKKSVKDYKKSMGEKELSYFESGIIMEKVVNFLKENNNLA